MLIKIISLAVTGLLMTVILNKYCRELVPLFDIALLIAALFLFSDLYSDGKSGIGKLLSLYSEGNEAFTSILKAAAIAVICRFTSDICREGGSGLMGDIVELGGRMTLVILALPFLEEVTEAAISFI